jgi:predicted small lipoprotein YifL
VRHLSVVVAIGAAVLVTACGQKGPLTLPDRTAAVVTTPPADAPTDKTKTKDKDKDKDKNTNSQPPQ